MYKLQLKELRRRAGFKTQKDIADRLGIKERKYATWERGRHTRPVVAGRARHDSEHTQRQAQAATQGELGCRVPADGKAVLREVRSAHARH